MTNEGEAQILGPIGSLIEQACGYADLGLEIFPVNPQDKTPLVSQLGATCDLDTIEAWWSQWPQALIGHRISPLHVVLDVDPRHGGLETWTALREELGPIVTRVHYSGRGDGGGHIWFQRPDDQLTITKLDAWARERGCGQEVLTPDGKPTGRWTCGIDLLRHEHRYTILPPSPHPVTLQPYYWGAGRGIAVGPAPCPQLLCDLLVREEAPIPAREAYSGQSDPDRSIADWYCATFSWGEQLSRHGWRLVAGDGESDGSRWRHPTSDSAHSATIRYGCLFVYSPNTPFEVTYPEEPHGYTLFRAHAVLEHGGDLGAAGREARKLKDSMALPINADPETGEVMSTEVDPEVPCAEALIDWPAFWARERSESDWLAEPLLARTRSHAIYSPAKTGKSLLVLEVAAALSVGAAVLEQPAGEPRSVVYFDLEMTEEDVRERLEDLGYGPAVDLSRFHYYLLPALPPLDTAEGGEVVEQIVRHHGADLVVFDTTSRIVSGAENDADTFRAFYAHTGVRIKRLGVTYARLDHAGKDLERGQRGASAKNDDVDVVWQLTSTNDGVRARATHRRMSWVPETVLLARQSGPLRHVPVQGSWPAGTAELAKEMDRLGVAVDDGRERVRSALREAGVTAGNDVLAAAIRYRRRLVDLSDLTTDRSKVKSTDSSTDSTDGLALIRADRPTDRSGQVSAVTTDRSVSLRDGQSGPDREREGLERQEW